jgi:hypothetical protein
MHTLTCTNSYLALDVITKKRKRNRNRKKKSDGAADAQQPHQVPAHQPTQQLTTTEAPITKKQKREHTDTNNNTNDEQVHSANASESQTQPAEPNFFTQNNIAVAGEDYAPSHIAAFAQLNDYKVHTSCSAVHTSRPH